MVNRSRRSAYGYTQATLFLTNLMVPLSFALLLLLCRSVACLLSVWSPINSPKPAVLRIPISLSVRTIEYVRDIRLSLLWVQASCVHCVLFFVLSVQFDNALSQINVSFIRLSNYHTASSISSTMGQMVTTQLPDNLGDTVSAINYEVRKHAQSLREINSLTYEEFHQCVCSLNGL